jgi:predicted RNA-binding Zn ribbon-like protein
MARPQSQFSTAEDLEFRFMAGRVSLAFTATVGERWRRSFERLQRPSDLARWLREAGLTSRQLRVSEQELDTARALREAIYRCAKSLMAGADLRREDIAVINQCAMAPTGAPQLRPGPRVESKAEDPVSAALSLVARDAIDLFAGRWASRIRECESDQCALLFVDLSRPGRRRWCSSETCGSRSRSAAYRERVSH